MFIRLGRKYKAQDERRGATTVEMALALPILMTTLIGLVEFSRLNMLRNTIMNATYEGARTGALPGATATKVRTAAQIILDATNTHGTSITVTPETIQDSTVTITVTISAPLNDNAWITPYFAPGRTLTKTCTLTRERTTNSR